jgi:predicted lysophospholipase L1 biosynthesis ABC-type transport system permease subunit
MQTIINLQVIVGCVAALLAIISALAAAAIMISANFKHDWPPDWFGNLLSAAALISVGFGIAEAFLAFTRYAIG